MANSEQKNEPVFPWANEEGLQPIVTALAGVGVFVGCWLHAIGSWGWFLGLSLGWIPSAILAAAAGWLAYKFWSLVLGLALLVAALAIFGPML